MRLLTWNLNHRARSKKVPDGVADVVEALAVDVAVFTEFVPKESTRAAPTRAHFLDRLRGMGLAHQLLSPKADSGNHVLFAARSPLIAGATRPPPSLVADARCMSCNTGHVVLPEMGLDILGMRMPDYSKQPKVRGRCWQWLVETATAAAATRPFVLVGDLNADLKSPPNRWGRYLGELSAAGLQHLLPPTGESYWSPNRTAARLDHAFASSHLEPGAAAYVTQAGGHTLAGSAGALSDHAALVVEVERRA
jgi:exonuclease III